MGMSACFTTGSKKRSHVGVGNWRELETRIIPASNSTRTCSAGSFIFPLSLHFMEFGATSCPYTFLLSTKMCGFKILRRDPKYQQICFVTSHAHAEFSPFDIQRGHLATTSLRSQYPDKRRSTRSSARQCAPRAALTAWTSRLKVILHFEKEKKSFLEFDAKNSRVSNSVS